jgi:hypothetical protein
MLTDGYVTVTPLQFDLTQQTMLNELRGEHWELPPHD